MIDVELFTDPGCPWAYSAEPQRMRLRWLYGDALRITSRMVGLSEHAEEYVDKGFTPEVQAEAHATMQARFGMPIDPAQRPRMAATLPACRAVVADHHRAPREGQQRVLQRAQRVDVEVVGRLV
nr:hypothetical protein [Solirubrobacterales bacterium]